LKGEIHFPDTESDLMIYVIKILLSAVMIVLVTEVAKRSGYAGGLIKSLPLISIMSFVLLYLETTDRAKVANLSMGTFWFVLPTLPTFLLFPYLLGRGMDFWLGLSLSILFMLGCYGLTVIILNRCGIQF
jgi:hypothetical protein